LDLFLGNALFPLRITHFFLLKSRNMAPVIIAIVTIQLGLESDLLYEIKEAADNTVDSIKSGLKAVRK